VKKWYVLSFAILLLSQIPFLLSTIISTLGDDNYQAFAQSEASKIDMNSMNQDNNNNDIISPLTEWVGIFALGITVGLVSSLKYKSNYSNLRNIGIITISVTILSISAGIIHLLLIQEHMKESFMWGIFFLVSGIGQIIFGIIISIIDKLSPIKKSMLYYFGIIGNTLLVGIFVFVRLFPPPFSSEASPLNELQPNGIIIIITEILTIVLLAYLVRSYSSIKSQRSQKVIQ
jgi:hypothetical protein